MRTKALLVRAAVATVLATGIVAVIGGAPAYAVRMPISATCPTCAPAP